MQAIGFKAQLYLNQILTTKMKHMLKYIFSLVFLLCFSVENLAQDKSKDTLKTPQRYGLRVGVDLHRLTKSLYDVNYKGFIFVS